ncbi:MAG: protein kinase [Proteobacteria bacterium]|nr:protein kinase [Pseudomonadota bacterium]
MATKGVDSTKQLSLGKFSRALYHCLYTDKLVNAVIAAGEDSDLSEFGLSSEAYTALLSTFNKNDESCKTWQDVYNILSSKSSADRQAYCTKVLIRHFGEMLGTKKRRNKIDPKVVEKILGQDQLDISSADFNKALKVTAIKKKKSPKRKVDPKFEKMRKLEISKFIINTDKELRSLTQDDPALEVMKNVVSRLTTDKLSPKNKEKVIRGMVQVLVFQYYKNPKENDAVYYLVKKVQRKVAEVFPPRQVDSSDIEDFGLYLNNSEIPKLAAMFSAPIQDAQRALEAKPLPVEDQIKDRSDEKIVEEDEIYPEDLVVASLQEATIKKTMLDDETAWRLAELMERVKSGVDLSVIDSSASQIEEESLLNKPENSVTTREIIEAVENTSIEDKDKETETFMKEMLDLATVKGLLAEPTDEPIIMTSLEKVEVFDDNLGAALDVLIGAFDDQAPQPYMGKYILDLTTITNEDIEIINKGCGLSLSRDEENEAIITENDLSVLYEKQEELAKQQDSNEKVNVMESEEALFQDTINTNYNLADAIDFLINTFDEQLPQPDKTDQNNWEYVLDLTAMTDEEMDLINDSCGLNIIINQDNKAIITGADLAAIVKKQDELAVPLEINYEIELTDDDFNKIYESLLDNQSRGLLTDNQIEKSLVSAGNMTLLEDSTGQTQLDLTDPAVFNAVIFAAVDKYFETHPGETKLAKHVKQNDIKIPTYLTVSGIKIELPHSFSSVTTTDNKQETIAISNKIYFEPLGEGNFGIVKRAQARNGEEAAIKVQKNGKIMGATETEILQLRNILKGTAKRADKEYTLMRNLGVNVYSHMLGRQKAANPLSEAELLTIALKSAESVEALHKVGIIHADIKEDNFMVNAIGNQIVIEAADFGLSKILEKGQTEVIEVSPNGSVPYMAPEIFYEGKFSFASDVYALGIMFSEIGVSEEIYKGMINGDDPKQENRLDPKTRKPYRRDARIDERTKLPEVIKHLKAQRFLIVVDNLLVGLEGLNFEDSAHRVDLNGFDEKELEIINKACGLYISIEKEDDDVYTFMTDEEIGIVLQKVEEAKKEIESILANQVLAVNDESLSENSQSSTLMDKEIHLTEPDEASLSKRAPTDAEFEALIGQIEATKQETLEDVEKRLAAKEKELFDVDTDNLYSYSESEAMAKAQDSTEPTELDSQRLSEKTPTDAEYEALVKDIQENRNSIETKPPVITKLPSEKPEKPPRPSRPLPQERASGEQLTPKQVADKQTVDQTQTVQKTEPQKATFEKIFNKIGKIKIPVQKVDKRAAKKINSEATRRVAPLTMSLKRVSFKLDSDKNDHDKVVQWLVNVSSSNTTKRQELPLFKMHSPDRTQQINLLIKIADCLYKDNSINSKEKGSIALEMIEGFSEILPPTSSLRATIDTFKNDLNDALDDPALENYTVSNNFSEYFEKNKDKLNLKVEENKQFDLINEFCSRHLAVNKPQTPRNL